MKRISAAVIFTVLYILPVCAQIAPESFTNEPGESNVFGTLNPQAPPQVGDFSSMVGICDCRSLSRNADGSWQDTVNMVWQFKYIMNGTAIQDEVWRQGNYATSIRQYHPDSARWVVTYYSYPTISYTPGVWHGEAVREGLVFRQPQVAPNGMEGFSTLTFFNISETGFNWKGEWIKDDRSFTYPFWLIWCHKRPNP